MTGGRVAGELTVLAGCFVTGLAAGVLYDVFRLLRLFFYKSRFRDAAFDLLFYAAAGVMLALALYELNGGSPRLYALAGFAAGALAYIRTVDDAISLMARDFAARLKERRARKEKEPK